MKILSIFVTFLENTNFKSPWSGLFDSLDEYLDPGTTYFRAVVSGGGGGSGGVRAPPPQFLADQLALSQPGGALCPPDYQVPPDFQNL